MGSGINSLVSSVAKPNIKPWSPAPIFSKSSLTISPFLLVSKLSTPMAMSLDCSLIATITPEVSH
jgi:hypothetical protein